MIPRDLDAPRSRFAVSKEYITHYKHVYNSEDEVRRNFDKWTLMPGRFKSLKEYAEQNILSNSRHENAASIAERERLAVKAKQVAQAEKNAESNMRRQETRKRNMEQKKKRKSGRSLQDINKNLKRRKRLLLLNHQTGTAVHRHHHHPLHRLSSCRPNRNQWLGVEVKRSQYTTIAEVDSFPETQRNHHHHHHHHHLQTHHGIKVIRYTL